MGGDNYLGNAIGLNCTVEARGTRERFDISWVYSGSGTNIDQHSAPFSQFLWFNSLAASHAGIYICNASLAPTTGSEQTSITLQCKTMTFAHTCTITLMIITVLVHMNLTVSMNGSEPVRAGDSISIICRATIDRTLVDVPVDVDLHLVSPQGMNKTQRFSNSNVHGYSFHQISMIFSNINAEISGVFTCNSTVRASSMNEFLSPANKNETFDLILGKLYCICNLFCDLSIINCIFIQFPQGQVLIQFRSQIIPSLLCGLRLLVIELKTTSLNISTKIYAAIHLRNSAITPTNK